MAQNIELSDRVRYFPTKTKADILPRLGAKFVATVIFNASSVPDNLAAEYPTSFLDWQGGYLNYDYLIGKRNETGVGSGIVSDVDYNIFIYGIDNSPLTIMDKNYPVFYGENVNPRTGLNSGFMLYDVYNIQPYTTIMAGTSTKMYAIISVDIYESTELINTATTYSQIN